jgi:pimeloyl-ACP methyl ester carboxylesterase
MFLYQEFAMPYATTRDHVQLYFEEAGSGTPIIFVHEFAADYAIWLPQMRWPAAQRRRRRPVRAP